MRRLSLNNGERALLFMKGDREDPGNYRGITLLSVAGKVFCKILNNRLVQCLDKGGALHEGQANVSKSAVMVFSKNFVEGGWKWGEHELPIVSNYLAIDFC